MTKKSAEAASLSWQPLFIVLLIGLALVVLVPQISQLQEGFRRLADANPALIGAGLVSVGFAVVASGGTYTYLALRPVRFRRSVLVQLAGMFVNRLFPAGVGGLGLNARFLFVYRHTVAEATTVAIMNNLTTGLGHFLLLLGAVSVTRVDFPAIQVPGISYSVLITSAAFFVAVVLILGKEFAWFTRAQEFFTDISTALSMYRQRPRKLLVGLCFAMCNTLGHTMALYFCMLAFDVHLSAAIALLVLTSGVAAASVTPTPGGVVGAEAGLAAALIGFAVAAPTAIAIAVSYRIVSYWLPLIPGALTFFYIQKRRFI